jgi:hypothetical protein
MSLAAKQVHQAVLVHLTTQRSESVDKHFALEVVEFVLHGASEEALDPLVVLLHILVKILHADALGAGNFFVDSGNREAALLDRDCLFGSLDDVSIDVDTTELLVLGIILGKRIEVDNHETDRKAYLGSREADTLGIPHSLEHIFNELLKFGIIGLYVCSHLSENRLAVKVNR